MATALFVGSGLTLGELTGRIALRPCGECVMFRAISDALLPIGLMQIKERASRGIYSMGDRLWQGL